MTTKTKKTPEENLKTLKRLRELPRGTQVESRIAAIEDLLGEHEIFQTLVTLRWPHGVICPRCHSTNVVRRDPPADSVDLRFYYECLNCKGEGDPSGFDDFTGLPINSIYALRQWILCWYLIGFCSVAQIAKVLGISINEVMQIATWGTKLTEVHDKSLESPQSQVSFRSSSEYKAKQRVIAQEEDSKSASKSPLKPGYKSKK